MIETINPEFLWELLEKHYASRGYIIIGIRGLSSLEIKLAQEVNNETNQI